MSSKRVLVVATSRGTRGGITAVVSAHEKGKQWRKYHTRWIGAYIDRSNIMKIYYFITSLIQYLLLLPFYDLVHIHVSTHTSVFRKSFYLYPAKLLRKKVITHLHCSTPSIIYEKRNRILYRTAFLASDVVFVLSSQWKKYVEEALDVKYNVRILYNPIISLPLVGTNYERKKYILFAGTIDKRKGYNDLIKAFSGLVTQYPEWKLMLAGNGEIEEGKMLAESLGISSNVEFCGWVSGKEKDRLFGEASIFCLPSYAEGFPMSVLDAWAFALPVACTPVGGIMDVAKDGENILLFDPGDIKKLQIQLEALVKDENLRNHIAEESHKLSESVFNLDFINNQLGEVYKELLGE